MQAIQIYPKQLQGSVVIPPSKSEAHRAIICASLSKGISHISNVDLSDDIIATIEGMRALGTSIEVKDRELIVDGTSTFSIDDATIDCNESGSTLRFLIPISLAKYHAVRFIGKGNLGKRPLDVFYNIFDQQGIAYSYVENELDLKIKGQLSGAHFKVPGNISSQFISGLLFTLPLLKEDSTIEITTHLESKGYIDLTLNIMQVYGIKIENNNYQTFKIKGNQQYRACDHKVEGDYSQAAFFESMKGLGCNILCEGLNPHSLQGDSVCRELVEEMSRPGDVTIDASQCPDIIPTLTVVAALREGKTQIINGARLRIKECDRLHAIAVELNKLGANVTELEDELIVLGVKSLQGTHVSSHDDHRIAMSMAVASTCCEGEIILDNPACVSKSYPQFWEDFKKLGGTFETLGNL